MPQGSAGEKGNLTSIRLLSSLLPWSGCPIIVHLSVTNLKKKKRLHSTGYQVDWDQKALSWANFSLMSLSLFYSVGQAFGWPFSHFSLPLFSQITDDFGPKGCTLSLSLCMCACFMTTQAGVVGPKPVLCREWLEESGERPPDKIWCGLTQTKLSKDQWKGIDIQLFPMWH